MHLCLPKARQPELRDRYPQNLLHLRRDKYIIPVGQIDFPGNRIGSLHQQAVTLFAFVLQAGVLFVQPVKHMVN